MSENLKILLGKNIKTYRQRKGLSQTQLAEMVDVSFRYISYVECGKSFPSSDVLEAISTALDVPVHILFCSNGTADESTPVSALKDALLETIDEIKNVLDLLQNRIEKL